MCHSRQNVPPPTAGVLFLVKELLVIVIISDKTLKMTTAPWAAVGELSKYSITSVISIFKIIHKPNNVVITSPLLLLVNKCDIVHSILT